MHNRQSFFSCWTIFCPLTPPPPPPNNPKNQNFEKMKKTPGDITILHNFSKNYDQMLHCFWDMTHDGCTFYFSFWAIFWYFIFDILSPPLHPYTHPAKNPKNQDLKKMKKKQLKRSSFDTRVPKIMILWCRVPEIWCTMDW